MSVTVTLPENDMYVYITHLHKQYCAASSLAYLD